jgi:NADH-quinone oxidoreductase subunit I
MAVTSTGGASKPEVEPGAYRPSTALGAPDAPRRTRLTPWNLLAAIAEGAWTIVVGHWVTWINLWRKKVTDQYPHRDPRRDWKPRPGYRGDFALVSNKEAGRLNCTACMQCATICPSGCIWIEGEGKGRERVAVRFYIDAGLCQYCGLCVEACPFDAITMTADYETAADSADKLIRDITYLRTRGMEFEHALKPVTVEESAEGNTEASGS